MAEYIDRRRLFNALADYWNIPRDWDGGIAQPCEDALAFIEDAPAADVAPVVHGEWIPFHSEAGGDIQYCSACDVGYPHRTDFCPNCGAKMDGERKGDDATD